MTIAPGLRLGPYEVVALIGEGGMGRVWRAHHVTLRRDDALKVLPEAFANDSERLARFEREAQVLASLTHANIARLYGFEEWNGVRALVMELVEGPTLADRVAAGALPLDEALAIARQIASALGAAHDMGIVHRDLKPSNIKLDPDGTVKVLDFGLAKMMETEARPASSLSLSPTITSPALLTGAGVILGSAAYMSPEQARGRSVDKRADIWAFGVVLYEMVAGRRLFDGEDVTDTLASVVKVDPQLNEVPVALRRLLKRCLEKDPRKRLRDIGDVWDLLDPEPALERRAAGRSYGRLLAWATIAVLFAALAALALTRFRETTPAAAPVAFALEPPEGTTFTNIFGAYAPSPDGRYIVFGAGDARPSLWLRPVDSTSARVLPGTEGGNFPTWSPDSRSLVFWAGGKLRRVEIAGGTPLAVTDAGADPVTPTGSWNRDGVILFGSSAGLRRVAATGGETTLLTRANGKAGERGHGYPQFLPDGNRFLYFVASSDPAVQGVYASSLDDPDQRQLVVRTGSKAVHVPPRNGHPGYLLWLQEQTLVAQRFDAATLMREGDLVTIAEDIGLNPNPNLGIRASFWASDSGLLVYFADPPDARRPLVWMSRDGKQLGPAVPEDAMSTPALTVDAKRVAVGRRTEGGEPALDVWIWDLVRETVTRLTFDPARDGVPVWSPDGRRVAFASERDGVPQVYVKDASGTVAEERLTDGERPKVPLDWSRDGRYLLYREIDPATAANDLKALRMDGDRQPITLLETPFNESIGRFSPDGAWLAYRSDESGQPELFVRSFGGKTPAAEGGRWQISNSGASDMKWRDDGRELYYETLDGRMMAVEIEAGPSGLRAGTPRELFKADIDTGMLHSFDVTGNGEQFLLLLRPRNQDQRRLTAVTEWQATLRSR